MAANHPVLDFFQSLVESSDQIVFSYSFVTGQFTYLNPAFEEVWHKTRKSVLDHPASLLKTIHPEDRAHVQQVYQELLDGIIIKDVELRIILRNKTERWVWVMPRLVPEQSLLVGYFLY